MDEFILQENGSKILLENGVYRLLLERRTPAKGGVYAALLYSPKTSDVSVAAFPGSTVEVARNPFVVLLKKDLKFDSLVAPTPGASVQEEPSPFSFLREQILVIDTSVEPVATATIEAPPGYFSSLLSAELEISLTEVHSTATLEVPSSFYSSLLAHELSMVASIEPSPVAGSTVEVVPAVSSSLSSASFSTTFESMTFSATLSVES